MATTATLRSKLLFGAYAWLIIVRDAGWISGEGRWDGAAERMLLIPTTRDDEHRIVTGACLLSK